MIIIILKSIIIAYQSYRAANRKVILGDFIKHPLESKLIILDFLKRKFK